jgi:hypothetical protein
MSGCGVLLAVALVTIMLVTLLSLMLPAGDLPQYRGLIWTSGLPQ